MRSPLPSPSNTSPGLIPPAVFLLALGVRLSHLWFFSRTPIFHFLGIDADQFHRWALLIAQGDWLGRGVYPHNPVYPLWLGLAYALSGGSQVAALAIQAVVGAASCALLSMAGTVLDRPAAGLAAGVMLALCPPVVFNEILLQRTFLDILFICALLLAAARILRSPDGPSLLAAGLASGALALTRENAVLLFPFLTALLIPSLRGRIPVGRAILLLLLGFLAAVTPSLARTLSLGRGIPVTTHQFSINFYLANNPEARGVQASLIPYRTTIQEEMEDYQRLAEAAAGRALDPTQVSAFWFGRALDFIRRDTRSWLGLTWKKVRILGHRFEMPDTYDQYTLAEASPPLAWPERALNFGLLFPLGLAGAVLAWPTRRRPVLLLLGLGAVYASSLLPFAIASRYRLPLVPILILLVALGVTSRAGAFLRWPPRLLPGLVVAIPALLLSWWPLAETDPRYARITMGNNLAFDFLEKGDVSRAMAELEVSRSIDPEHPHTLFILGLALRAAGRHREALEQFLASAGRDPSSAQALYAAGRIALELKDPLLGLDLFRQAFRREPYRRDLYLDLYHLLRRLGMPEDARQALRWGLEALPADQELNRLLAGG
jgi:tetratricopeptide (TPR) repeat protein